MPRVRVYLCTYRRPHLFERALRSLLAQTCVDWVCEVHNDDPDDVRPREILTAVAEGDSRFEFHQHRCNFGPVATFNLVFAGGPEPFASLLEDDNWWDPPFLETLLTTLESNHQAALAWANMRIWSELEDGTWRDTNKTVWTIEPGAPTTVTFTGPELYQAVDALHSNGAMVFRPAMFRTRSVPTDAPLAVIESLRERAATGDLLLVTAPLAHFARTLNSARTADRVSWLQSKLLIATSFFQAYTPSAAAMRGLWTARRNLIPADTDMLFQVALALRRSDLVAPAGTRDWIHFVLRTLRHPAACNAGRAFAKAHPETWAWLLAHTAGLAPPLQSTLLEKRIVAVERADARAQLVSAGRTQ